MVGKIQAKGLSKSFGKVRAVDGLDLNVEPGEIVGFLGPNGAGKSTTVKMLTGMIEPDSGQARVCDIDVAADPVGAKRCLGYVPESGALYESLSPAKFLRMVGSLYGLRPRHAEQRKDRFLELFGMSEARDRLLGACSKGMKQKVLISAALLSNPQVLFLDEPLNGLDASAALVVKTLLKELAGQGRAILFCSHILDVIERVCTRVVIIHEGRKLAEGASEQIAAECGADTLENAFVELTGVRDTERVAREMLVALQ